MFCSISVTRFVKLWLSRKDLNNRRYKELFRIISSILVNKELEQVYMHQNRYTCIRKCIHAIHALKQVYMH